MKKIRGFKLNLRLKELQRRAKKAKLDLASLGFEGDASLSAWIGSASAAASPAVLYDSFPAGGQHTPGLTSMPGLAYSLCISTLGADWELLRERSLEDKPALAPLFEIATEAALEEAVRFVSGLVEEEAKAERCALSPIQFITETPALQAVLSRLEGHKIGVAMGESALRPACSIAFSLSWLAKSRTRAKA